MEGEAERGSYNRQRAWGSGAIEDHSFTLYSSHSGYAQNVLELLY